MGWEANNDPRAGATGSADGRCAWCGTDPVYVAYHDTEWGVPEHDARALWEKLVLDGFQAGLAWITVLKKREAFRRAFDGFDPEAVARYGAADRARLMADPGIIRSGAKIDATVRGARIWLDMRDGGEDFSAWLWGFVDGRPIQTAPRTPAEVPTQTAVSVALSKALKARGFGFCGPVITYAFMQATGMVNDHLTGCFRCDAVRGMGEAAPAPATSPKARAPRLTVDHSMEAIGFNDKSKPSMT